MTRKRFVKLVMSCGHDRNYANARADVSISVHESYQDAWGKSGDLIATHAYKAMANAIAPAFECLVQQCKGVVRSIEDLATGLGIVELDWGEHDG